MQQRHLFSLLTVFAFLLAMSGLQAQPAKDGTPASIQFQLPDVHGSVSVSPTNVDWNSIEAEDQLARAQNLPLRAGFSLPVNKSIDSDGTWEMLPDGRMMWRLRIETGTAVSVGVVFDMFHLPEGAELFIYNGDKSVVIGAFTSDNNNDNNVFSTQPVPGSTVIIEYIERPEGGVFNGTLTPIMINGNEIKRRSPAIEGGTFTPRGVLRISEVLYVYNDVVNDQTKDLGDAGTCQVNINCSPEGDNWQDEKRGVARILYREGASWYYCSGTLVNNTLQNGTPYFLTAYHCGATASAADHNVWLFNFNYERAGCANSGTPPTNTITGCVKRAEGNIAGGTDMQLVELSSTPSSTWNIYYNGWDRSGNTTTGGVSIHHPSGDAKKISTFTGTTYSDQWWDGTNLGAANGHWTFPSWASTPNGQGVSEGGSSGSPLFNSSGRVIGTLSGGSSDCAGPFTGDLYGKFSIHWQNAVNGTGNAYELKYWLDPAGTNPTTLDGMDPNAVSSPPVANFSATPTSVVAGNPVQFSDLSTNLPQSWSWSFQNGFPATSNLRNPTVTWSTPGTYSVTLTASNAYGSDSEVKVGYITVTAYTAPTSPVTIGTGTTTAANFPYGIANNFKFVRSASIYTPAEIGGACIVNSVAYYPTTTRTDTRNIKIYMKHTPDATFTTAVTDSAIIADATLVYNGTFAPTPGNAWFTHTLQSQFLYNGYQNLMVIVFVDGTANNASSNCRYTTKTNAHMQWSGNADPTAVGTINGNRPNTRLGVSAYVAPVANFGVMPTLLTEGFEAGALPTGWIITDADGDGNNWEFDNSGSLTTHGGTGAATSASWATNPLTPDNWLIAPAVDLSNTTPSYNLRYYVLGQDPAWEEEHYGVYVSTTGTAPANFTLLYQETLPNGHTSYLERTLSLDAYKGNATVYVAFRHFNSTDWYQLNIDDVSIYSSVQPTQVTLYEGEVLDLVDLSTNNPTMWNWSNPSGTPTNSYVKNPSVQYNVAGIYNVSLTAANSAGSSSTSKTNYVNVVGRPPIADFYGTGNLKDINFRPFIPAGGTVNFEDLSTQVPTGWSWTFSGGSPASHTGQTPPAITYSTPGFYSPALTVTNLHGTDNVTGTDFVVVGGTDTCTNMLYSDGISVYGYTNGLLPGHAADASGKIWRYADFYSNDYNGTISGIHFGCYRAQGTGKNVTFYIWDGSTGSPGTILFDTIVPITMFVEGSWNFLPFLNDVPVTGDFFVGYELTYDATHNYTTHQFCPYMTSFRNESVASTGYFSYGATSPGTWYSFESGFGQAASVLMNPEFTYESTGPIVTASATAGCATGSVTLTSTVSANQTFYLQTGAGAAVANWTGNTNTHTFTGLADGTYKGYTDDGVTVSGTSNTVTLTNDPASAGGTLSGTSTQICFGSNTGVMTLAAYTGTITKWQKSNNGGSTWTDIVNTAATYSEIPGTAGTWLYRVEVVSGTCPAAYSNNYSITVDPTSVGGSVSPATATICLGSSTGTLTLSGHTGTVTKWQKSNNGGVSWTDIANTAITYSESPASAGTWQYRAVVQSGTCATANSASTSITVNPVSVGGSVSGTLTEICVGSSVGTLTLTGYTGTITKWQKSNNGGTTWTDIANTNATYTETPATAGTWLYRAVVQSGVCSSANSSSFSITVYPASVGGSVSGTLTQICLGSSTGTLTLSGHTGTITKWQKSNNGGTTWTDISHTAATYSETPGSAGTWLYRAVVQSGVCGTANSASFSIVVDPTTVAGSVSGTSPNICLGSSTGTLTLSGHTGSVVKWQKSNNGGTTWTDITNTAATYSETPATAGTWMYRAVVQSGTCSQLNSTSYSVIVAPLSVGGTVSGGSTPICLGSSTGTMTLSGHTGSVVKWQKSNNGGTTWTDITNTAVTYSETPATAGTWMYRAVVQSGTCGTANSASQSIVVDPASVAGTLSGPNTEICSGSSTGTLTLSGYTGTIIRWERSDNGGTTWMNLGNTAATYSEIPGVPGTRMYRVIVQSGSCSEATSNVFTITIDPATAPGTVSGTSPEICLGSSTGTLTLSAYSGAIIKWQKSNDGGTTWIDIANTAATYSETPATAGTWMYRAVVQSGVCSSANSVAYTITVSPASVGGTVGGVNTEICLGNASGTMTLSGHTGSVVKWQKSNNGGTTWTDITNTAVTYSETPATAGTWLYRAVVQSGSCSTANSSAWSMVVHPVSAGGTVSAGVTQIFLGDNTGAITLSANTGAIIRWEKRLNAGVWTSIASTANPYSEIPSAAGFWDYRAVVQSGNCTEAYSTSVQIEVLASSGGSVSGGSSPICLGTSTGVMTLSGYTGTIIRWQKSSDGGATWTNIANTAATYSETPAVAGTWLYRVELFTTVTIYSAPQTIVVNPATVAGSVTGGTGICLGSSTGTLTLSGHTGSVVKWQVSTDGGTSWTDIANTSATYSVVPASTGTYLYRAVVQSGVCTVENSAATTVVVSAVTVAGSVSGGSTICLGSSTGTLTLSGHTGTVVKWQKQFNAGGWTDITNTATTYSETPGAAGVYEYRAVVQSGSCSQLNAASTTVTVNPASAGGSVNGSNTNICLGENTGTLTLSGHTGTIVKWQKSNNGGTTWTDIANTNATYSEIPASAGTWMYRAVVQSGVCSSANSASFSITVHATSVGGTLSGTTTICAGNNTGVMTLSGYTGSIVKWQRSGDGGTTWSDIANTSATYSEVLATAGTYLYRVVVQNGTCAAANSSNATITVDPAAAGGAVSGTLTAICIGDNTGTLTLSGQTGAIIRWQKSNDGGSTWTNIANTTTTYSEFPSAGTWLYRVEIQSGTCGSVFSTPYSIVVSPLSVGGTLSGSASVCLGSSTGTMTLTGYTGSIVKWQKSNDGGSTWSDITNTSATYSEATTIAGMWIYRVVVQSGTCSISYSSDATINVDPLSVGGSVTGPNTNICLGDPTGTMTLSGHTGTVVKWQSRVNAGVWNDIVNNTTSYGEIPASAGVWEYRAEIQSGSCGSSFSVPLTINVNALSVGGTLSGPSSVCEGHTTGVMTLSGYTGTIVKWQSSIDGGFTWSDIANTAATYSETVGGNPEIMYQVVVQNGTCGFATSNVLTVTIDPTSDAGVLSATTTNICEGSNTGTITLASNIGAVLKWQKSNDGGTTWTDIVNTSNAYDETPTSTGLWEYRVIVQSGVCGPDTSNVVGITVSPATVAGTLSGGNDICESGSTGTLTLSGYSGAINKWQSRFNGGAWNDIVNTSDTWAEVLSLAGTYEYRAEVQSGGCGALYSNTVTIEVSSLSVGGSISTMETEVCEGESTGTIILSSYTGNIIKWQRRIDGGAWTDIAHTGSTYDEITTAPGFWEYRVEVQNGVCASQFATEGGLTVIALPVPSFTWVATDLVVDFTNTSANATSYSWNFGDGTANSTQVNPTHTYATENSYNVVLTAFNSACQAETTEIIEVVLSVIDLGDNAFISIYPNPSNGEFFVALAGSSTQTLTMSVFDVTGRLIYAEDLSSMTNGSEVRVSLGHANAGMYHVRFQYGDRMFDRIMVVE